MLTLGITRNYIVLHNHTKYTNALHDHTLYCHVTHLEFK